jgi:hypothetical protein
LKILCQESEGFYQAEMSAWSKSFVYQNNEFIFFDRKNKSIFDAFYEIKPDIFLGVADECTKKLDLLAKKYEECKIVLINIENKFNEYSQKNIYKLSYLNNDISPCFDFFVFKKGQSKKEYLSEINYIANEYDDFYLKLLNNFDIKIFGKGDWNTPKFLGNIEESEKKHIIASCQYSVCGSKYKDIKWFIECVACDTFCFAYKNEYINKMFSSEFCIDDYKEIFNLIIINKQSDNISKFNNLKTSIISNYSSNYQLSNILKKIGLEQEVSKWLKV